MLDWFAQRWNDFIDFMWRLMLTLFDILKDFFYWIFDEILSFCILVLDGMGSLLDGLSVAQYFSALPPETVAILSQIGLSEAMGMVITSLTIRFFLQVIPFVRWGS